MRLTGYKLHPYRLPLVRPLAVRGSEATVREGALLMVRAASGAMGWGDVAPLPGFSAESLPVAVATVRTQMEMIRGRELITPDVVNRPPMNCGSAAFALDAAILGCMGAEAGLPLRLVLADDAPDSVAVNALLEGTPETVVRAAMDAADAGYRSMKLKVGRRDPGEEARLVRRVREAIGEHIHLRLDANRAWTLHQAHEFFDLLPADTRIEYIEEPLQDPGALPGFPLPVALDESLAMPGWEEAGAVAMVLKPSVQDGIAGTLRLANTAREHGLKPVVSSLFESGVGLRALAALAAAVGEPGTAHGLDTLRWFVEDAAMPAPVVTAGRMMTDEDALLMLNPNVTDCDSG